jgi:hypothetical protein
VFTKSKEFSPWVETACHDPPWDAGRQEPAHSYREAGLCRRGASPQSHTVAHTSCAHAVWLPSSWLLGCGANCSDQLGSLRHCSNWYQEQKSSRCACGEGWVFSAWRPQEGRPWASLEGVFSHCFK